MALSGFNHRITWTEFRLIAEKPPGEIENAQISCESSNSHLAPSRHGGIVTISQLDIRIYVDIAKSWVVEGQPSDVLLRHEQGHFDILAIGIREFYNGLLSITASSIQDLQSRMNDLQVAKRKKTKNINDRYDSADQTDHGKNAGTQQLWEARINATKLNPNGILDNLP
ncbi:MAG: DUF922 domain-containing protein [Puia sp.]